jgi:hypothetical protein
VFTLIKNIDDINAALDYIREENQNFPKDFGDKMDADSYNLACQQIEYQLNVLYEKIRLIQDVDEFARTYAELKISEKEQKLRDNLKIIEDVVDLYHDDSAIAVMVPIQDDGSVIHDRDGSVIPKMQISDGKLVMDTNVMGKATIAYINNSSESTCYNSSYVNLVEGRQGTSTYLITDNLEEGVVETISIDFTRATPVNYLSIKPVNAIVRNVRGILTNHVELPLGVSDGYFAPQELIGIKFDLVCKDFEQTSFYTDAVSYDTSETFGFYPDINTHMDNGETIKQMEKSILDSERKYLASIMNVVYSSREEFNQSVRNKNVKIAEGN